MVDDSFGFTDEVLCLPDQYILIEMLYLSETPNIEQVILDLQIKGYMVILAHLERYNFYHKDHPKIHRLKDMGVLFQMNILSVLRYYGKEVKQIAEYLLKKGCYDLIATDLHHDKLLEALPNSVLCDKLCDYSFKNKVFAS